jgi:hypothetical protein
MSFSLAVSSSVFAAVGADRELGPLVPQRDPPRVLLAGRLDDRDVDPEAGDLGGQRLTSSIAPNSP